MTPHRPTAIAIDLDRFHANGLVPVLLGATIVPRPGVVTKVDLPFIRTTGSGLFEARRPTPGPGGGPPPLGRFLSP